MTHNGTTEAALNDQPRQQLAELLKVRGEGLLHDPNLLEELLRAQCPDHRREVTALMNACREGIPAALKAGPTTGALIARLKLQLQANQSMQAEAASWAVDAWKQALPGALLPSGSPVTALEEKLETKDVRGLIRILGSFAAAGGLCLFVVIQLGPPVLGFFLDLKTGFFQDLGSGNYAGMIGKTVIAVIAGGILFLVLSLAAKLLGIVKKAILK
jgi:hypothetical protein